MSYFLGPFLFGLAFLVLFFLIFREFVLWYFRINDCIKNQLKTNHLLELIGSQLGGTDTGTLTILEESTGRISQVKVDAWIEFRRKNPNATGYRVLRNQSPPA